MFDGVNDHHLGRNCDAVLCAGYIYVIDYATASNRERESSRVWEDLLYAFLKFCEYLFPDIFPSLQGGKMPGLIES